MPDQDFSQHRLINSTQLRELWPVSAMSVWRAERQSDFPRHLKIRGRSFWRLAEVLEWLEDHGKGGGDVEAA